MRRFRLTGYIVAAFATFSCTTPGQQASPQFEVASVKPVDLNKDERCRESNVAKAVRQTAGVESERVSMPCVTLKGLIAWAYNPQGGRIEGGPQWTTDSWYDVEAKAETSASVEQKRLMLQALLADRFQLQVHRESPVRPVFALVGAKGGPKLHEAQPGAGPGRVLFSMSGKTQILTGERATMSQLASWIASGRPIIDETGLTGTYDFRLEWLPDDDQPDAAKISALQQELGLKLEDRRAPVEVLIIDRAEKPKPNE